MSVVLSIDNLNKVYGSVRALNGVSFDVPEGTVFGILGPNGSGKTTLLGIVMDVLKANKGTYRWFGQPGSSPGLRKKIGTLLETPNFYTYLSGYDNLRITSAISGRGNAAEINSVLKKVNLFDRRIFFVIVGQLLHRPSCYFNFENLALRLRSRMTRYPTSIW